MTWEASRVASHVEFLSTSTIVVWVRRRGVCGGATHHVTSPHVTNDATRVNPVLSPLLISLHTGGVCVASLFKFLGAWASQRTQYTLHPAQFHCTRFAKLHCTQVPWTPAHPSHAARDAPGVNAPPPPPPRVSLVLAAAETSLGISVYSARLGRFRPGLPPPSVPPLPLFLSPSLFGDLRSGTR